MNTAAVQLSLDNLQKQMGLEYEAQFVPFSRSRSAVPNPKLEDLRLEWDVLLWSNNGRLRVEYGQGIGHIPGFESPWKVTVDEFESILAACETSRIGPFGAKRVPAPKFNDVLYCLVVDSDVLEYARFEEWAEMLGYDVGSRKAEDIYRKCLEQALALRRLVGDPVLRQLRELFQDY